MLHLGQFVPTKEKQTHESRFQKERHPAFAGQQRHKQKVIQRGQTKFQSPVKKIILTNNAMLISQRNRLGFSGI